MARLNRNILVTGAGILAAVFMAGCGTTASIETREDLANVDTTGAVIFGKFHLVRNGHEASIGGGLFETTALLHVDNQDPGHGIVGKVGADGEFAWVLEPGDYVISSIAFDNRGEMEETAADFAFTVPPASDAVYIGTVTLEVTLRQGLYGTEGFVDNLSIDNECEAHCEARLQALGLARDEMTVSLLEERHQLARTN